MKKVMLVDDAAFLRRQLRQILEDLQYTIVAEATNGEEAIRNYEIYKPDIIFMDITMPIMDGIEASEHILKSDPQAKIIICSALGHKELVVKTHKIGVSDFVVKPFHSDRVEHALQKLQQATAEQSTDMQLSAEQSMDNQSISERPADEQSTEEQSADVQATAEQPTL